MPRLENPKHEAFAVLRAKGRTLGSSYATAFGHAKELRLHSGHGSRVAKRPEVTARIEELRPRSEAASSGDLDPEFVIQNLLQVLQRSVESGKFTAANRTLELLGKFQGMFQSQRDNPTSSPLDDMDSEQLVTFVRRSLTNLGPGSLRTLGFVAIEPEADETPLPESGNPGEQVMH